MRTTFFWVVTQREVVMPFRKGFLTLEYGTDRLPKRRSGITTTRYVVTQKSVGLIYSTAEVWNHAFLKDIRPPSPLIPHPSQLILRSSSAPPKKLKLVSCFFVPHTFSFTPRRWFTPGQRGGGWITALVSVRNPTRRREHEILTQRLENRQLKEPMKEHAFISINVDPEVTVSDYSFNPRSHDWCMHPSSPPHVPRHQPPRSGIFDQTNSIWWRPQVMQLLTVQSPAVACHLVHRSHIHLPQHPMSNTLRLWSSLNVRNQVSYPHKTTGKIIIKYILMYTECNRRNGPDFGRMFLMLNYTEKTPNTYIQSWTVSSSVGSTHCTGQLRALSTLRAW
jgi:hypothetical protein